MTTLWLLNDDDVLVGVARLRHALNDFLLNRGGHIGYYVKESERGKGYGRQLLALTLVAARGMGLQRVLVTADSENTPSLRVIEGNGGVLEDERYDEHEKRMYRRYWIEFK